MAGMKQQRRLQSAFLFSEAGLASACLIAPHNAAEHPALQRECRGLCLGSSVTLERERERVCVCWGSWSGRILRSATPLGCVLLCFYRVFVDVLLCQRPLLESRVPHLPPLFLLITDLSCVITNHNVLSVFIM